MGCAKVLSKNAKMQMSCTPEKACSSFFKGGEKYLEKVWLLVV